MYYARTIEEMKLDGGIACLDFVNSSCDRDDGEPVERLHDYEDLLTLCERVHLIDYGTSKKLRLLAKKDSREARRLFMKAMVTRKLMWEVFTALATKRLGNLGENILTSLNIRMRGAFAKKTFRLAGKELVEDWQSDKFALSLPLDGLLLSAYELLKSGKQEYIKKCAACDWLFLDQSKSHRRKWCDMQTCGSSVKSRKYYRKKKGL